MYVYEEDLGLYACTHHIITSAKLQYSGFNGKKQLSKHFHVTMIASTMAAGDILWTDKRMQTTLQSRTVVLQHWKNRLLHGGEGILRYPGKLWLFTPTGIYVKMLLKWIHTVTP